MEFEATKMLWEHLRKVAGAGEESELFSQAVGIYGLATMRCFGWIFGAYSTKPSKEIASAIDDESMKSKLVLPPTSGRIIVPGAN